MREGFKRFAAGIMSAGMALGIGAEANAQEETASLERRGGMFPEALSMGAVRLISLSSTMKDGRGRHYGAYNDESYANIYYVSEDDKTVYDGTGRALGRFTPNFEKFTASVGPYAIEETVDVSALTESSAG